MSERLAEGLQHVAAHLIVFDDDMQIRSSISASKPRHRHRIELGHRAEQRRAGGRSRRRALRVDVRARRAEWRGGWSSIVVVLDYSYAIRLIGRAALCGQGCPATWACNPGSAPRHRCRDDRHPPAISDARVSTQSALYGSSPRPKSIRLDACRRSIAMPGTSLALSSDPGEPALGASSRCASLWIVATPRSRPARTAPRPSDRPSSRAIPRRRVPAAASRVRQARAGKAG